MSSVETEKVPEALRKHFALFGVEMCHRENYRGHPVFVGDGCKTPKEAREEFKGLKVVDTKIPGPGERSRDDLWMRNGYFITAFAFLRGKAPIGFPLYFEYGHDLDTMNPDSRRQARINSALYAAKDAMDAMMHVGLLEDWEAWIIKPYNHSDIWVPHA